MRLNQREIRVFAMRRSGHHAVVHWLIGHFKGEIFFRNAENHVHEWNATPGGTRELYIFNLEDAFRIKTYADAVDNKGWLTDGVSQKIDNVLVLRDPYNMLASRLAHEDVSCRKVHAEMWKEHAREYLRETNALPDNNTVMVSFNAWYADEAYRRGISARLGLKYTAKNLRRVTTEGKGSSFQKDETDARRLDLFNRWRACVGDIHYMNMMADDEMHELAQAIFGDTMREIRDAILQAAK